MNQTFHFTLSSTNFDEHYRPSRETRATTNFANLARGRHRQQNLRNALRMIDNRFNALACWDNPDKRRYSVELKIISVDMMVNGQVTDTGPVNERTFPTIEMLKTTVVDHRTERRIEGIVGNNFSSYLRDYDFSVLLPEYNREQPGFSIPEDFGELHGLVFRRFVNSSLYRQHFAKPPVICLSVSDSKTYHRTDNRHPVLGIEYRASESSLTEQYFSKMGLQVRYFLPPDSVAPLAFYFLGDLLADYSNLELISTISTMETFQKIYRPEIYNANSVAGNCYQPDLKHPDHSLTLVHYDREERTRLAIEQGRYAEEHFIKPYQDLLAQWVARPAC